jgi:serine/threonine protein kinase
MNSSIRFLSAPILHPLSIGLTAEFEGKTVYIKKANQTAESMQHLSNEILVMKDLIGVENILLPLDCWEGPALIYSFIEKSLLDFLMVLSPEAILEKVLKPMLKTAIHLHEKEIVHGDIKLENVRVSDQLDVYLCDFGKAVRMDQIQPHRIQALSQHQPPDTILSPLYDVYSLGVLAYQLLFGIHFIRDFQLKGRDFSRIPESQGISEKILNFIFKATAPSAADRFSSAQVAYSFLFEESNEIETSFQIESSDLKTNFEIYLEFMKQTFQASSHSLARYDQFIGPFGEKYFSRLQKWSQSLDAVLIHLKHKGQVIGMLEGSVRPNGEGMISTLFIHECYRQKGSAQLLEKEALNFFRDKNCSKVGLNVSQANKAGIRYYEKTGWLADGEQTYPDSIHFSKILAN